MTIKENLEVQIYDVKTRLYDALEFNHVDNPDHLKVDEWLVYGPYTRSVCYQKRASFIKSSLCGNNFKVFTLVDGVTRYYLVDCNLESGQYLYNQLRNYRSLLYRLQKELNKN